MTLSDTLDGSLAYGGAHPFSSWPNSGVPKFGAGVYTIWHNDGRFIYVGMSGRNIKADTAPRTTPHGIYTRLQSHASGRRSGDQFCVYVADRLVLPMLSYEDIISIGAGEHQFDALVRRYIHQNLSYRFVVLPTKDEAYEIEATIKRGEWEPGRPLLNPSPAKTRNAGGISRTWEGEGID